MKGLVVLTVVLAVVCTLEGASLRKKRSWNDVLDFFEDMRSRFGEFRDEQTRAIEKGLPEAKEKLENLGEDVRNRTIEVLESMTNEINELVQEMPCLVDCEEETPQETSTQEDNSNE